MTTKISEADYHEAVDQYLGWCCDCEDFTVDTCEPDAEGYPCPVCGSRRTMGAENALIGGIIDFE